MSYAALILAHRNPQQVKRLVNTLQTEGFKTFTHIDKKASSLSWQLDGDVCSKYSVYWGGYSTIRATLLLMEKALKENVEYLFLVSGQDYLLKNSLQLQQYFVNEQSYMTHFELPCKDWSFNGGTERFEWYHFQESPAFGFRLNNYAVRLQRKFGIKRNFIPGFKPYGGSQWWTLSRSAAMYVLEKLPMFERYFKYTLLSDEFLFQTLLMNSTFSENVINDNLRKIEWHRGPEYPRVWRLEDVDEIMNSNKIFARKFDASLDNNVLDVIDSLRSQSMDAPFIRAL